MKHLSFSAFKDLVFLIVLVTYLVFVIYLRAKLNLV